MTAQNLWQNRAKRVYLRLRLAEVEAEIVHRHTQRRELRDQLDALEAETYRALRAMGCAPEDIRLDYADKLADAFIEGNSIAKLGVLPDA